MGRRRFIGPAEDRLGFEDLAEMLRSDYLVNGRRSLAKIDDCLAHLRGYFGLDRALDISADRIKRYVIERQKESAAHATINRELAALKRAFNLAVEAERLSHAPYIAMLEEHNVRQGFVGHGEFLALREHLPEHLKDPVTFLYLAGWRVSEMKALEWRDADLAAGTVRLRPELSKNKDGRVLPLSGELAELLGRRLEKRRLDCPFVFHLDGRPLRDFRGSWATACRKAGLAKLLVHDLRRTVVRNLVRAGVPERVAMEITGHKTRSVFERYNIVSEADRLGAVQRLDAYLGSQPTAPTVVPLPSRGRAQP
jgi:integrase